MARDTTTPVSRLTFPIYLLPSFKIPFRRRQTDTSISSPISYEGFVPSLSTSPESSITTSASGSPPFPTYFIQPPNQTGQHAEGKPTVRRLARTNPDTLRCGGCSVDLAFVSQIVSKGFTGRHGRAYLVSPPRPGSASSPSSRDHPSAPDLVNIRVGRPESRQLVTGAHVVADITCVVCDAKLGWKYVDAKEPSQKYKVGKFILETERVVGFRSWEDVEVPDVGCLGPGRERKLGEDEEVAFDSDDEDECEDIFAGTWDADAVAKRRSRKFSAKRKQSSE